MNKVTYEWSLETLEDDDIIDSDFSDKPFTNIGDNQRMCLVRDEWDKNDSLSFRLWAYVVDDKLPEYFEDANGQPNGYKVPQKFIKQLK